MATNKTQSSTIELKGNGIKKERVTKVVIKPGYLVESDGDGGIRPQATAQADCAKAFAIENRAIGNGIEVSYKAKERVIYAVYSAGKEVQAKLPAGAAIIAEGDALESNGGGTVRKLTANGVIIGRALQGIDNSQGLTETFISIEVA